MAAERPRERNIQRFYGRERANFGRRIGPGDTAGLAASADGAFHPLWIDHRTQTPHVWTATIMVGKDLR